jgi:para-nitrobenzyl esterase
MANDISAAATGIGPIVETVSGKLRGSLDNGIHTFKGVPYGASTAGHNRFRSPQPTARLERRPRGSSLSRPRLAIAGPSAAPASA